MVKNKKKLKAANSRIGLDLGCGQNKVNVEYFKNQIAIDVDQVIGVDYVPIEGVEMVHNLTQFPYPFADESIDGIFSSHFIEHLDGFERAKFFDECYRILKMGAKMRVVHPYGKSTRAAQDFTHKWPPIVETSYCYWDKNWREANKLTHGHYDLKCDFEFNIYYSWQDGTVALKNRETQLFWSAKYWDVVADLIVDLKKR